MSPRIPTWTEIARHLREGALARRCADRWQAARARYGPKWKGRTRHDGAPDYLEEALAEALDGLNYTAAELATAGSDAAGDVARARDYFQAAGAMLLAELQRRHVR